VTGPLVSIILPTFNRLRYLRPAVDSVFAQTFSDWELIVADDGSTDETAAYLAALEDAPRVRVLRLTHTGNPGTVRNAAWRVARGEYIAFLDSDDIWLPEKLRLQVESLRSRPERGWSHTAFTLIDEAGQLLTGPGARTWPAVGGSVLERLIRMEVVVATPSVMVRRELLEHVGGFDASQRMCEDYDLWLRLAALSEIDGVSHTLLYARRHREHFHQDTVVFEHLRRALEKMLVANTDRSVRAMLRRERARVAAHLARSQAVHGGRWAALLTLAQSSPYSWGYPQWWLRGAGTAARAVTPTAVRRIARSLAGGSRGA
jgi:glycosyltransferase involved in cell wall biosynthesis